MLNVSITNGSESIKTNIKLPVVFCCNLQALHRFRVSPAEYEEILNLTPKDSSIEEIESIACTWLKGNERTWHNWVPMEDKERTEIMIGGIFPMGGKVYTAKGILAG